MNIEGVMAGPSVMRCLTDVIRHPCVCKPWVL